MVEPVKILNLTNVQQTIDKQHNPMYNDGIYVEILNYQEITLVIMAFVGMWGYYIFAKKKGLLNERQLKALMWFNTIGIPIILIIYVLIEIWRLKQI